MDMPMGEARRNFAAIVRRAAVAHERVTITDDGRPAAVLVNPEELAELEEAAALAEHRARRASGDYRTLTQAEVRERLNLAAPQPPSR